MLLQTTDSTHFQQYLIQLKQSFIYQPITFNQQDSPFAILLILLPYLSTFCGFTYSHILQMLFLCIMKNQLTIKQIDKIQFNDNLNYGHYAYSLLWTIVKNNGTKMLKNIDKYKLKQQLNVKSKMIFQKLLKIKQSSNSQVNNKNKNKQKQKQTQKIAFQLYFTNDFIKQLMECIKIHSDILNHNNKYNIQQTFYSILQCIEQFINGQSIKLISFFIDDLNKWIEIIGYKSIKVLAKLIQIIDKLFIVLLIQRKSINQLYGLELKVNDQIVEKIVQIIINRNFGIKYVYQYWSKIQLRQSKWKYFSMIIDKYFKEQQQKSIKNQRTDNKQQSTYTDNSSLQLTKYLRMFYLQLHKQHRVISSRNSSQIKDNQSQKFGYKSQFNFGSLPLTLQPEVKQKYMKIMETLIIQNCKHQNQLTLLNSIYDLFIVFKDVKLLTEKDQQQICINCKKYLQKDKKGNQFINSQINQNQAKSKQQAFKKFHLNNVDLNKNTDSLSKANEKNKKIIVQNLFNTFKKYKDQNNDKKLKVKLAGISGQNNNEDNGFQKFSKYLITR